MSPLPRRGHHQGAWTAQGLPPLQGHGEKTRRVIGAGARDFQSVFSISGDGFASARVLAL
jgi:hypothetical protein